MKGGWQIGPCGASSQHKRGRGPCLGVRVAPNKLNWFSFCTCGASSQRLTSGEGGPYRESSKTSKTSAKHTRREPWPLPGRPPEGPAGGGPGGPPEGGRGARFFVLCFFDGFVLCFFDDTTLS
jgi:hypothetical protein